MHIGQEEPLVVEVVDDNWIAVETEEAPHCYRLLKIGKSETVLKAPKDWEENEKMYSEDEYWLEQADKLGI